MAVRPHKNKKKEVVPGKWDIDYYPQGKKGKKIVEVFEGTEDDAREYEMSVRRGRAPASLVSPKVMDVWSRRKIKRET